MVTAGATQTGRLATAPSRICDAQGIPVGVSELWRFLQSRLPEQLTAWEIGAGQELTAREAAASALKSAYFDLIEPVEKALLNMRRDGAQYLDPLAKFWAGDERTAVGTYALWLCAGPAPSSAFAPPPWLVLDVGLWAGEQFFAPTTRRRRIQVRIRPRHPAAPATPPSQSDLDGQPQDLLVFQLQRSSTDQNRHSRSTTPVDLLLSARPRQPRRCDLRALLPQLA